jgi:hypothetical protein
MVNIHADNAKTKYRVERFDRDRLHDMALLHHAVYGTMPAKNYYVNKYDTAYTGAAYIGYIAYNSDDFPVAYYGVMPCFMQYNNQLFLAAQSGDTMTHPGHRIKGLFVELSHLTFELCRRQGIRLLFGFPNQNSLHGAVHKLGWTLTGYLDRFSIPVSSFPLERLMKKSGWSKWLYEQYCRRVFQKYLLPLDGLPQSATGEEFGRVYRSDRYLEYKRYNVTHVIEVPGAKVWIRLKHYLDIGDMQCEEEQFPEAINELQKIARRLGIREINFHVSPGTRTHALFATKFSPSASFPICIKDLGADIPLEMIKFSFADIDIF